MSEDKALIDKRDKALKQLDKECSATLAKDTRSAISRLMWATIARMAGVTSGRKALLELQARFKDWNEVRISELRDIVAAFTASEVKDPDIMANAMLRVLADIYEQHNIVNFEWERLDVERFRRPEPQEPGEEVDVPTIREEGLPKHESISGFLDGPKLVYDTSLIEAKIIDSKNTDAIFSTVWDNPNRVTSRIVWAVALEYGLCEEGLTPTIALPQLRRLMDKEQLNFARFAIQHFENSHREVGKFFKGQADDPDDTSNQTPYSVQIGFMKEEDVKPGLEPLMPRSEGIGRPSKRAKPRVPGSSAPASADKKTSGRRPAAASGKRKAVK